MSFFSSPFGLSSDVTHTINLKIEKFEIFISTRKNTGKNKNSSEIVLTAILSWLPISLNTLPLIASM